MEDFLTGPQPEVPRVPGAAVYLTSDATIVPSALFHNLKNYKVMHRDTVFLHVVNENSPYVSPQARTTLEQTAPGVYDLTARFGFREEPDIPTALAEKPLEGPSLAPMATSFSWRARPSPMGPVPCPAGNVRCMPG